MIQSRFNDDFDQLLKETTPKEIAIAVSGGADSIALLYSIVFSSNGPSFYM